MSRCVFFFFFFFCREGLNHERVADLTYNGKERAQERETVAQNGKSCALFAVHFSTFLIQTNLHVRREIPRYRNLPELSSGRNRSSLLLLFLYSLFFFDPVMAAELAVVLEMRQTSQIFLSLLELLSTFSRFIIVVWRRAFHKRFPFHPTIPVITPRRRIASVSYDALKEIKKDAFIRDEEKINWRICFIVIFRAIKAVLLFTCNTFINWCSLVSQE